MESGAMIDRLTFRILLGIVALVPLPFAAVHAWSSGLLAGVCGVLLLSWTLHLSTSEIEAAPAPARALLIPFILVAGWALLQASPFSPASWHHPLWRDAASVLARPLGGSIALDADSALSGVLRLGSAAAIFWLSTRLGRDPERAATIVATIAWAATGYAVYGLIEQVSGSETILWYRKYAYINDLTSTFVNKNNYATYAGLGWLCALALFYRSYTRWMEGVKLAAERLRQTVLFLENTGWRLLIAMFALIGSLLYSHSRAGFASSVAGILAFCLALAVNRTADRALVRRFGAVSFLLALAFFAASGRIVDARIAGTDFSQEERPRVYALTLTAITDQPLLGSGLGSFEDVFRFYRGADIGSVFTYAHNSYLETALELGLPATILLIGMLVFIFGSNGWGARIRRRDSVYPCLGIGATILVGLHSLLDFSIQIPAVTVTYAAIAGVAFAQSFSTAQQKPTGH